MVKDKRQQSLQLGDTRGSTFERDFFRRTLGQVVRSADVALTELVANAWDAGASTVKISTPTQDRDTLIVEDDGVGLTNDEFLSRWMRIAYDRRAHQGDFAVFPRGREDSAQRRVFGRNGQGRHGLLCFNNEYEVVTCKDGERSVFRVVVAEGDVPLEAYLVDRIAFEGHGTKLEVKIKGTIPDADDIRQFLSARFLHDPQFKITVDGETVELEELRGVLREVSFMIGDKVNMKLTCVQIQKGNGKQQNGVAFWVGNRLVGEASWLVGGVAIIDGRTRQGKSLMFVLQTDDLFEEVLPDWTNFRDSSAMEEVYNEAREQVKMVLKDILSSHTRETREEVMNQVHSEFDGLSISDGLYVADVVEELTENDPLASTERLFDVASGIIKTKEKRSAEALVARILTLPEEDIQGLARLLDEWSVRDALTVLDEINQRIKTVEAIEKLIGEPGVDELHVLHPLITQTRWLFGPEFESSGFISNVTIRNAVEKIFGKRVQKSAFENARNRPDLILLKDATFSAVARESFEDDHEIPKLDLVLLIELKRTGKTIGRKEMDQATGYVEDLRNSVESNPRVSAFVVGDEISKTGASMRWVGEDRRASIRAMTFSRLVSAADARLHRIRGQVAERYEERGVDLVARIRGSGQDAGQLGIRFPMTPN